MVPPRTPGRAAVELREQVEAERQALAGASSGARGDLLQRLRGEQAAWQRQHERGAAALESDNSQSSAANSIATDSPAPTPPATPPSPRMQLPPAAQILPPPPPTASARGARHAARPHVEEDGELEAALRAELRAEVAAEAEEAALMSRVRQMRQLRLHAQLYT